MENFDWTSSVGTLITIVILPLLFAAYYEFHKWLRTKISVQQLEIALTLAREVTLAVEQLYTEDKKIRAMEMLTSLLRERGINLNVTAISNLIEAAVFQEFNRKGGFIEGKLSQS